MSSVADKQNNTQVDSAVAWSKENIRQLRLRMGWSRSDIARRLQCSVEEIELCEDGKKIVNSHLKSELEILLRQAEAYSDEVRFAPSAENICDKDALEQIEFSRVKAELE
jgi:ribosome-binding protein aMBF1 (putative translation factor)